MYTVFNDGEISDELYQYRKGELRQKINFSDGDPSHITTLGRHRRIEIDIEAGRPSHLTVYEDDAVKANIPMKDGEAHGDMTVFEDPGGSPQLEMPMVEGEKHGLMKGYLKGTLRVEQPYENDKRHGRQRAYYEDGTLAQEADYKEGKLHGEKKMYSR